MNRLAALILIVVVNIIYGQVHKSYEVQLQPDWTRLLDRTSGWTGSDDSYSIPLNGYEMPNGNPDQRSVIVFGDTFIGEVDANDVRQNSVMIRNTIAVLDTIAPDEEQIHFLWNVNDQQQPEELFKADTPTSTSADWIWPMDGIAINGRIYIYGLRLFDPQGWVSFEVNGVTLISFELDDENNIINYRHIDTPLFYKDASDTEFIFGQAILPMTISSGNPNADGYIYIYGPRNRVWMPKEMIVGRFLPENIENFTSYEFWDGSNWQSDLTKSAVLTDSISQEFSVSPLNDGRYAAVFQLDEYVAIRTAPSLLGPFSAPERIYYCPEIDLFPEAMVYNAKAHPHLSDDGSLLISYNVNTSNWEALYNTADIYHPRFIRWEYGQPSKMKSKNKGIYPEKFRLNQNYPNPFNPRTKIEFEINSKIKADKIEVMVCNALGKVVKKLKYSNLVSGKNTIEFNAGELNSGIYFYTLFANDQAISTKKMILLK